MVRMGWYVLSFIDKGIWGNKSKNEHHAHFKKDFVSVGKGKNNRDFVRMEARLSLNQRAPWHN